MLEIKVENDKVILKKRDIFFSYAHQYLLILKEENLKITLIGSVTTEKECEFYFPKELKMYILKHLENFKMKLQTDLRPVFIFSPLTFSKVA